MDKQRKALRSLLRPWTEPDGVIYPYLPFRGYAAKPVEDKELAKGTTKGR